MKINLNHGRTWIPHEMRDKNRFFHFCGHNGNNRDPALAPGKAAGITYLKEGGVGGKTQIGSHTMLFVETYSTKKSKRNTNSIPS